MSHHVISIVIPAKAGILPASPLRKPHLHVKTYYVYMLASRKDGVLYIGVTNDLLKRVWEHKNAAVGGFTEKYFVHRLVWYEMTNDVFAAIAREKQLKKWERAWKVGLIEKENIEWRDLSVELSGG